MNSAELREKFLTFFENNKHERISSSSLIPQNDPTLLFANAGMNQFKDFFTGKAKAKNKRATTSQKCVRAGGKHNDLDNVGKTARHHTFFEMLGNFSFGDYFKSEAIDFAWKFLTEELLIDKNKLYITVHESDDEAKEIWMKEQGIPEERIFKLGDKDNFWEMGDTGPCGPCSEIFYDHGEKYKSGNYKNLLDDEERYVEIWNLVFMQFEKHADGSRTTLPKPSVDTGAGLERLSAVLQGVYWNYDTDLFQPIIKELEKLSGKSYQDTKYQTAMRVVADHIRSCTMLISDGVIPSNDGRGYVLRRIIRRAVRFANELGFKKPSLYLFVDSVFEILGEEFKQNMANESLVKRTLELEESKFRDTLEQGLKVLNDFLSNGDQKTLKGEEAFKLYDTYGFPIDLTQTMLEERGIKLDRLGFEKAMQAQVERSRAGQKFQIKEDNLNIFYDLKDRFGETDFIGYEHLETKAKLLHLQELDDYYFALFDKTPFYAESGGQVGDSGTVGAIEIVDTQKPVDGLYIHILKSCDGLSIDNEYQLRVNESNRSLIVRNHSATHMLQSALGKVLGDHVKQSGSLVSDKKLRFDFTHDKALSQNQIDEVEFIINQKIDQALAVTATTMSKEKAIEVGAKALFGEKYGDEVRVISMQDFSTELCGGTHVHNTSEIQLFKIISESSLSTGVRRIEALTSFNAIEFLENRSQSFLEIEELLKVQGSGAITKVQTLLKELKELTKENEKLKDQIRAKESAEIFNDKISIGTHSLYHSKVTYEVKELRKISDEFVNKFPDDLLFLYNEEDSKGNFILRTHKKNSNWNLSLLTKEIMAAVKGRGGGKPDMTQGSFPSQSKDQILDLLKDNLS